jgi:hypothetical protein
MPLLTILLVLVVVGVVLWAIQNYVPMEAGVKRLLNIAVILILIVWLLRVTGVWAYLARITL